MKWFHLVRRALLASALFASMFAAPQDVRIKVRTVFTSTPAQKNVQDPMKMENVYYLHGSMRRKDAIASDGTQEMSELRDCEKQTVAFVDSKAKEYRMAKPPRAWSEDQFRAYLKQHPDDVVLLNCETVDTGEQRKFFGRPARHLITTTERPDTHEQEVEDGWYWERPPVDSNCRPLDMKLPMSYLIGSTLVRYPKVPDMHHVGPIPMGQEIEVKFTTKSADGRVDVLERTVQEYSEDTLPATMFEIPKDMKENPKLFR